MTALEGLATHLGGLKQGRKTLIFVSEGFAEPVAELRDFYEAANRSNVAVYPVDPRGMTGNNRGTTAAEIMNFTVGDRDMLRALADETGGRAIVYRNDIAGQIGQIVRDATAYYLIAYESPHPADGKFHRVTVRVTRPHATVFARPGYWSAKQGRDTDAAPSLAPAIAPAIQQAVDRLADSLRPDADEPAEAPRRIKMPEPAASTAPTSLLADPTVAVVRGRTVSDPVTRREFRRSDIILVRAAASGDPTVTARLLDRQGRPLTDIAVTHESAEYTLRLPLGNLGAGDYVIELSARGTAEDAQQFVAFRVAAR
jgi:hypothetical protein